MVQQIIFKEDSARSLYTVLAERGVQHPFILTGRHATVVELAGELSSGIQDVYIKEDAEVTREEINRCYNYFAAAGADAVVAIGGGRVIDLAKAVIHKHRINSKPALHTFLVMPTTAGSGSEATQFAVVYEDKIKTSLDEPYLLPDVAILDPLLTWSVPPLQTGISGMDALAQAIESYWNIRASPLSAELAGAATGLLIKNLHAAVKFPNKINRENMMWGAHLAGQAINITRTTGPHALSYFLTAHYNIAHGQAVAFFLPLFFIYNAGVQPDNCNHPQGAARVIEKMNELYTMLGVKDAQDAAAFLVEFIKNAGLATTLAEYGLDKNIILDDLLRNVNQQRFNNNPVALDITSLKKIGLQFL